jgi:hypothetical protein
MYLYSRDLLEKLVVTQLMKKFLAVYGIWRIITLFTRTHHCTKCWARWDPTLQTKCLYKSEHFLTNSHSTSQDFPHILWDPNAHYIVYKSLPLDQILSQMNPKHCRLTPWSTVPQKKLIVTKKLPAFYWNRRLKTMFMRSCHWTLSWAIWILTLLTSGLK